VFLFCTHLSARIWLFWKLHQSPFKRTQQSVYWSAIWYTNNKFNSMMHHTLILKCSITSTDRYLNYIFASFVTGRPQYWFHSLWNLFLSSTVTTCKWMTSLKSAIRFTNNWGEQIFQFKTSLALYWEWIRGFRGSLLYIFVI